MLYTSGEMQDKVEELIRELAGIKSLPERRRWGERLARELDESEIREVVAGLRHRKEKLAWELLAHLAPRVYEIDKGMTLELIEYLARDDDWELREEAATVIKKIKKKHFRELYPILEQWVEAGPYLARAVSVGLIQKFKGEERWVEGILDLFERIVRYDDRYVKKNCGPFGLAAIFRRYPEQTERRLREWVKKYRDDEVVLWNVMMVFSQANAKYFPEAGKRVLALVKGRVREFPRLKRTYESVKRKVGVF